MAKFLLRSKHINRKHGSHATDAAAYRAGESIYDERAGLTFNHSDRTDVLYKEILLPADLAGRPDMAWARDRSTLWNTVEQAARSHSSRLAFELLALLPSELTRQQHCDLARRFSGELAESFQCAVDLCIHLPRPHSDERFHHAHILMTTRQVTPAGLGRRTELEMSAEERRRADIPGTERDDRQELNARWAQLTNDALRMAGFKEQVDHRTYAEQGINEEPPVRLPRKVFYAELRSGPTAVGDALRAERAERAAARLQGPEELARVVQRQKEEARRAFELYKQTAGPKKIRVGSLSREERREYYRALREADPVATAQKREISREQNRQWRKANPEKARESRKRWLTNNRDHFNAYMRQYRRANAQQIRHQRKTSYQANIEKERGKRRSYYHRNAERINRKRREDYAVNREEINCKRREDYQAHVDQHRQKAGKYRSAHRQEINLRARQYRLLNGEEINRRRREKRHSLRLEQARAASPTPEQAIENWQAYRRTHGPGPTAEESARNWAALRQRELEKGTAKKRGKSRRKGLEKGRSRGRNHDFSL